MKSKAAIQARALLAFAAGLLGTHIACGQSNIVFRDFQRLTNKEVRFSIGAPTGQVYRVDCATNVAAWNGLTSFRMTNSQAFQFTDSGAPYLAIRFYSAQQLTGTNLVTGDYLATDDGEVIIRPINHATFVMRWKSTTIYVDPVGGASRFTGLPKADLVLVTHDHGDHLSSSTITAVTNTGARILASQVVYNNSSFGSSGLRPITTVLTNGAATTVLGIMVLAVPAYNTTTTHHQKGVGNGYLLTIGNRRIYIAGDTEDTTEMRALQSIDVAFLPMNQPYTMKVTQAVGATRAFQPRVVYPYHYQGNPVTDLNAYKQQVGTDLGIEVRLRPWY